MPLSTRTAPTMTDKPTADDSTRPALVSTAARLWPAAAATLCVSAAGALSWQGGWPALVGVGGCALGVGACAWIWLRRNRHGTTSEVSAVTPPPVRAETQTPAAKNTGRPAAVRTSDAMPMVTEVVPVWARQLHITRESADTGLSSVLQAFAEMSGALDTLLGQLEGMSTSAQPGAVDNAVEASSGPLSALLGPSLRAFEQRDKAQAEVDHCVRTMQELLPLARQAMEIGRHTRLVAFNASIEASRDSQRDGGNEAVAHEMRLLAQRMSENGAAVHRLTEALFQRLSETRNAAVTQEVTSEELRMELDLRAREALQALMSAVGASLSTSGSVRDASAALRNHLDEAFVHFQFGDRVSQMLAIIGNDMNNFVDWVGRNPVATVDDANEWLRRLEASYTMEEQRSEHHGNVHVDRSSEVEFF
jgi:methyl-accepting chemotaxis protein